MYDDFYSDADFADPGGRSDAPEEWVFTFGYDHVHPVTGDLLSHCYVRVPGDIDQARRKMMDVFGRAWSQQYPLEMGLDLATRHMLTEIPWGGR